MSNYKGSTIEAVLADVLARVFETFFVDIKRGIAISVQKRSLREMLRF